jgi:hypothetical protein
MPPPVPIPIWTAEGVLPPLDEANPVGATRAPYPVSLADLVARFATSPERCAVLQGFLAYRLALHANGYIEGFQWLDGSFMEDMETIEHRPPRDLDVVSFVHTPRAASPTTDEAEALDHDLGKARYMVDGYFVELDDLPPRQITDWSAYWYSLWAHRRNKAWKGFLQVELRPDEDAVAAAWLAQNAALGVGP